jgi:hypothetical protein
LVDLETGRDNDLARVHQLGKLINVTAGWFMLRRGDHRAGVQSKTEHRFPWRQAATAHDGD